MRVSEDLLALVCHRADNDSFSLLKYSLLNINSAKDVLQLSKH